MFARLGRASFFVADQVPLLLPEGNLGHNQDINNVRKIWPQPHTTVTPTKVGVLCVPLVGRNLVISPQ